MSDQKMNTPESEKQTEPKKKRHFLLTFLIAVLAAVLLVIFLVGTTIIIIYAINPAKPPSLFGFTPLVLTSDDVTGYESVEANAGDLVIAEKVKVNLLKIDDRIAFYYNGEVVVGKIEQVGYFSDSDDLFYIVNGGSFENLYEVPSTDEDIIGKINHIFPKVGSVILFLASFWGRVLFICIPLAIILFLILWEILARRKKEPAPKPVVVPAGGGAGKGLVATAGLVGAALLTGATIKAALSSHNRKEKVKETVTTEQVILLNGRPRKKSSTGLFGRKPLPLKKRRALILERKTTEVRRKVQ